MNLMKICYSDVHYQQKVKIALKINGFTVKQFFGLTLMVSGTVNNTAALSLQAQHVLWNEICWGNIWLR